MIETQKMTNYDNINLPKWSGLLVKGKPVSREQAMEILIRTDTLSLTANDREFTKQLNKVIYDVDHDGWNITDGIKAKLGTDDWKIANEYEREVKEKLLNISLSYLYNSRIISAWVGGPHGWCDWEGNIESSNYNIGKHPSVASVYSDWVDIAKAFPFLDLRSQLLNGEASSDEILEPSVEFIVKDGKVEVVKPTEILMQPTQPDFVSRFTGLHPERGCDIEQVKEAVNYIKTKYEGTIAGLNYNI